MNITKLFIVICLTCLFSICIPFAESQLSQEITINADGNIIPSSAFLQKEGNTYTLTADLISPITIERGNIIIDGANHTLAGPGSTQNFVAITLMASNVTLKNLHISGWKAGVYGAYNNATIANNMFTSNSQAIAVYAEDYIIVRNIISSSSDKAILIDAGSTRPQGNNNLITQNQITNNNWAFDILNSNGTTITKNNVTSNAGIVILGTQKANTSLAGYHLLCLNNFVNNDQTLQIPFGGPFISGAVPVSPAGQWDNGSGGNYWSDYRSRYPNATEIGNSGIGNTPYTIIDSATYTDTYANGTEVTGTAVLGMAVDRYPLMNPFSESTELNPLPTASPSQTPFMNQSPSPTLSPSPSIPEFPSWTILSALLIVTALVSALFLRKRVC